MPNELLDRISIDKVTVSCSLQTGPRSSEFVSISVTPNQGEFTIDEAHLVHLNVSKEVTKMAYMDALARGTLSKDRVEKELGNRMKNYDILISRRKNRSNTNDNG